MFRRAKFLMAFLVLALGAGPIAFGQLDDPLDDPRNPMRVVIPSPTVNPELEVALVHAIAIAKILGTFPQFTVLLANKREADIYAPATCRPPADGLPIIDRSVRQFADRAEGPRTTMVHDGETYVIGSPEFEALSVKVDPVQGLPISCERQRCEIIIPASIYKHSSIVMNDALNELGFVKEPRIYQDSGGCAVDWCTNQYACYDDRDRTYYRPSDRTRIDITMVNHGRGAGSLRLAVILDSEPYCDGIMAMVLRGKPEWPSFCPAE